ncbi:MAG: hypothetical protein N3A61_08530, partial [Ignavibacteria bacterium]|nr:hypothetical protein [Ignavibacteria bacterium]
DPENLPSKPAEFPYGLLKFRIEVEKGEKAEIRITYPSLEELLDDSGRVRFYKFNAEKLEWSFFDAEVEGNMVILRFQDGGFGDEDGIVNGVIADDGGVGWVGYSANIGASICVEGTHGSHLYLIYVSGDFTIRIFDGDSLTLRVFYPNGSLYGSYLASSNNGWNNFSISVGRVFGWWGIEIYQNCFVLPAEIGSEGNYYGLNITGADDINIRVNNTWTVDSSTFFGTHANVLVGEEPNLNITQNYYVVAESFSFSVYDSYSCRFWRFWPPEGDWICSRYLNALNVTIYRPNGSIYGSYLPNSFGAWSPIFNVSGEYGIWRINVSLLPTSAIDDYDDYPPSSLENVGGNHYRLAVNLSEGLYFKAPVVLRINGTILHDLFPLGENKSEDLAINGAEVF